MSSTARHRRPKMTEPAVFDEQEGGADPATISQAAHDTAHALVYHGRDSDDPEITERFIRLAETEGIEAIAELWADSPAHSLAGSLWRIYAIRAAVQENPRRLAEYYRTGRGDGTTTAAIAGVPEPPTSDEMTKLADMVLAGMYTGDIDVAFDRAASFCRVIARGEALWADNHEGTSQEVARRMTTRADQLIRTAEELETSARAYRAGTLD
ncbi:hypothetical protein Q7C18_15690 [Nesterenkonia sp. CL21]|uniref:hypothetical protein n=1 Tax=Nesterenkonia sp. CL21 TaxID=3064894 RepID=UPI0028790852|nr:hypothetical protein [Nesterenkonia sp. CL21]MDS2174146.1 hypothetical protein [Nesterenkonia sp. CL21]